MKVAIFFLISLLFISSVSALPSLNIYGSEDIYPEETVIGNITGVNQTLTSSNVKFFDGRREVSFEKNILSFNGTYYFSFVFNRPGNFTLKMENILYYENDSLKSINLEKTFEVKEKENDSEILSIKPGVILTTKEFELILTNKGQNTINYSYGKNNKSSLTSGQTEKIKIIPTEKFSLFEIQTYKNFYIPIIYLELEKGNETNKTEEKVLSLRTSPLLIELQEEEMEKISFNIELFNFAKENLTEFSIKTNLDFLKMNKIETIYARTAVNLTLEGTPQETGVFQDNLTISYMENGTKESLNVPLTIYVFKKNASEEEIETAFSCIDFGGRVCPSNEVCDGNMSKTIDGCCIGFCQEKKSENNSGVILGIFILIILGVGGYFIYKKFKNVKPKEKIISS